MNPPEGIKAWPKKEVIRFSGLDSIVDTKSLEFSKVPFSVTGFLVDIISKVIILLFYVGRVLHKEEGIFWKRSRLYSEHIKIPEFWTHLVEVCALQMLSKSCMLLLICIFSFSLNNLIVSIFSIITNKGQSSIEKYVGYLTFLNLHSHDVWPNKNMSRISNILCDYEKLYWYVN